MQDRYAGDVGDFIKLGLLRSLVDERPDWRLGVNWYLVDDEGHNADGKHIAYLEPTNRFHTSLKACDEELMSLINPIAVSELRTVAALEASRSLPVGYLAYGVRLGKPGDRAKWHSDALTTLAPADLVFLDPDNGIRHDVGGKRHLKYAFHAEAADYIRRRQSLVVYHHADRSAKVSVQVARRMQELHAATGVTPLGAVIARRYSTRFFFIVPSRTHRSHLARATARFVDKWSDHAEFIGHHLSK